MKDRGTLFEKNRMLDSNDQWTGINSNPDVKITPPHFWKKGMSLTIIQQSGFISEIANQIL